MLDWYNREHHPERIEIEGFLRASRFRAVTGRPAIFINYEVRSPEVLGSEPYLARVNAPTAWTQRCMPDFRNNSRTVCRVSYDSGEAIGGYAATIRLTVPREFEIALRAALVDRLLPEAAARPLVVRAQLWEGLPDITAIRSDERRLRPGEDAITGWCITVFASALEPLRAICGASLSSGNLATQGVGSSEIGLYACEYVLVSLNVS